MTPTTEVLEKPSLERFQAELGRLVELFGRNLNNYKSSAYDEASLRQEFLNPFFRALGWDMENSVGPQQLRKSPPGWTFRFAAGCRPDLRVRRLGMDGNSPPAQGRGGL